MADIWVMGRRMHRGRSSQLVRADAVTHLMASDEKLSATRIESGEFVTLIDKDAVRGTLLP